MPDSPVNRLLFVTCGTSLTQQSRCWNGLDVYDAPYPTQAAFMGAHPCAACEAVHNCRVVRAGVREAARDGGLDAARSVIDDHWERIAACWAKQRWQLLPAELATLWRVGQEQHTPLPGTRIVLVYGESNRADAALLFAMLERLRLEGDLSFAELAPLGRPPRWDPVDRVDFDASRRQLEEEVSRLIGSQTHWASVAFILTGGYKGVLADLCLHLGHLAAAGQLDGVGDAVVYYLHDHAGARLMWLPIRRDLPAVGSGATSTA